MCVLCSSFSMLFFFSSRRRHTRCALVTEFRRVLFRSGPGRRMVAVRRGFVRHRLLPCSRRRLYRDLIILRSSLHAQHQDTRDDPAPEGHFGTAVPRSLAPSARHTQQEDRVPARLCAIAPDRLSARSEEHTSELQSLMRISYAVFCLKKKKSTPNTHQYAHTTYIDYTTNAVITNYA